MKNILFQYEKHNDNGNIILNTLFLFYDSTNFYPFLNI